jgi:hypothetical protein
MAWRIHDSVVRGEVDNRTKGCVRGRIWFKGLAEPIALELAGDAHPDLAGCLLTFENPGEPMPLRHDGFAQTQRGTVGDMTASRKVRVPDVPIEEFLRLRKASLPAPEHMANCLYLEWYSESNGRVVIESADYRVTISEPAWQLTPEEATQQSEANAQAFKDFMQRLSDALEQARTEVPEDRPMTEFEWEKSFRESDALTDKAMELFEKYGDDPDFEEILAREMGWDKGENDEGDEGEDESKGGGWDVDEINRICEEAAANPPEPNPLTEGVDWVRDEEGHVCHPLERRIRDGSVKLWKWCEKRGLLGENGDADLHDMIFHYQCCGAKCAGALGGLAFDDEVREPGFVVAGLKRALALLHQSLEASERVQTKGPLPAEKLGPFRQELFAVREEILALMERFRGKAES